MENDSKKYLHYAASLFLLFLCGAILWQIFGPSWFKNIKMEVTEQPNARVITVSGEGKITTKPDLAMVSVSVVNQGGTVKAVTEEGNKKMNQVVAAVKALGIADKDVATSSYRLTPEYRYPENGARQLTGYSLNQQLTVKIRDLAKVDQVLDGAIKAGANEVGDLSFDLDDASEVKSKARQEAFDKARAKAEEMARLAGVKLGRVVTFSESTDQMPTLYPNFALDMVRSEAVSSAPAVEPGSKEVNLSVSVTYEIE